MPTISRLSRTTTRSRPKKKPAPIIIITNKAQPNVQPTAPVKKPTAQGV